MPLRNHWPPGEPLPIQEVLPKNPKLQDLPRLPYQLIEGRSCPNLIYCIWKSGRHAAMRTTCRSWRCQNCAPLKMDEMTQILADATIGSALVYDIITTHAKSPTILRTFKRNNISALSLKFSQDVYLVASDYAEGRDWKLNGLSRAAAISNIQRVNVSDLKRRDFTHDWKPEPNYAPKRDTVVYSTMFANMNDLEEIIGEFGLDIKSDYIDGDPLDVMERMTKFRSDYTIEFGEYEYLVE